MWRVIPVLLCLAGLIMLDARADLSPRGRLLLRLIGFFLAVAALASLVTVH